MPTTAMNTRATVIPCLRYRDAPKAIEWLCSVLGFEKHRVVLADDGTVAHAQLSFGNGMVMLAAVTSVDTPFGRLTRQPDEIGGMETQSPYLVVVDADGVYQRAIAAGAHSEIDIKDDDFGGRSFSCRDPEGHLWSVGSYDAW